MEKRILVGTVAVGPCGGAGGSPWAVEGIERLTQIQIWHGDVIDAIQFQYYDWDGSVRRSNKMGGPGGSPVQIDFVTNEILYAITGYTEVYRRSTVIKSLVITTNVRSYGPFGSERGMSFSLPAHIGNIAGFQGRAGQYLDAIGLYLN